MNDFMPIDAYHYDTTGKYLTRTGELRIDRLESQLQGRPVPQVPANCTLIAPPPELIKSGDLYFDEGRQSWYVIKAANNNPIISLDNPNPPLTPEQSAQVDRDAAMDELEELANIRMAALGYDPFKSSYRMYLEMYTRQFLQNYLDGKKADPGWLSVIAAGHKLSVPDYCNVVIGRAYKSNASTFKILALKGKYTRLINGAAPGPRLDYVLTKMRQEIGEVTADSVLNLEDI